jgi:glycosyltransferase involved in cell wall biosynthesis
MRIALTTLGVFHSFALARELDRRQQLDYILSPFPWQRLQREGLARTQVRTFPWLAAPYMLLGRYNLQPLPLRRALEKHIALTLDHRAATLLRRNPQVDTLIALSSTALTSGRQLQQRGGTWICDRGSTHIRFAERILVEEYARWHVDHTPHPEAGAVREEHEYAAADYITVPSNFAARTFVDECIAAEKIRVLPYGVRLDEFHPAQSREAAPNAEFNVLFAGALSLRKGVPYLLEAFASLNHPRKKLRLAGAMQPDLRQIISRLPQQNVEFLGAIPQADLAKLMQQSSCLVLPSLEEGLALVLGQALASGCPVIATPNTGAEDLFTNGVEGLLVPPRDPAALTAAMQQLAENNQLRSQMREAAIQRVQTIGGWTRYGDLWQQFLTTIAKR